MKRAVKSKPATLHLLCHKKQQKYKNQKPISVLKLMNSHEPADATGNRGSSEFIGEKYAQ